MSVFPPSENCGSAFSCTDGQVQPSSTRDISFVNTCMGWEQSREGRCALMPLSS